MYIYKNGDRCPCCGTVIQGKSREWLLEFSATVYALGFREPRADVGVGPCGAGPRETARIGPERTAESR